ncbi:MAG: efflux RND transporter permease subunit, partial [Gammaproteobacteria bacterium]|nr:efflux RND transporter permease subunit [Gammaproteobacteria bacterium]
NDHPADDPPFVIAKLRDWQRRDTSQQAIVEAVTPGLLSLPGAFAVAVNPPSLVGGFEQPVQFVLSGGDYAQTEGWARQLMREVRKRNLMRNLDLDHGERGPQLRIEIDRRLAHDLGVSARELGDTLRLFLQGDDITEFHQRGETYQVVVQGRPEARKTVADILNLQVRGRDGDTVPVAAFARAERTGAATSYRRVNREPAMVLTGVPAAGIDLGQLLGTLRDLVEQHLPARARTDTLGLSREFTKSSAAAAGVFALALLVTYLVLAALFESFVYPLIILIAVPLAVTSGLLALWLAGMSFNTFSQVALLLLIGLLAKNAILVVDFANRRRREGATVEEAVLEACRTRFRPILMTSIATSAGGVPLALATGPGAEAREIIGIVIVTGTIWVTLITVFLVPGLYRVAARLASVPGRRASELDEQLREARDA